MQRHDNKIIHKDPEAHALYLAGILKKMEEAGKRNGDRWIMGVHDSKGNVLYSGPSLQEPELRILLQKHQTPNS